MHHQAVARDILGEALRVARREGGSGVRAMRIAIDPSGHIEAGELALTVELLTKGTTAEGAIVTVTEGDRPGVVLESVEIEENN